MTHPRDAYWKTYLDADVIARCEAVRRDAIVESTGVALQVDLYEQTDPKAPVLIVNHGGGGYSRLFVEPALELHRRGYTVVAPNQRGQGYSAGDREDFTIGELVENIVDVTIWARLRYSGSLYLLGGSIGSGLVYNAAASGAPVDALICHNLYDFGRIGDSLALSRFAALGRVPGFSAMMAALLKGLSAVMPGQRVPFGALGNFKAMVDDRDQRFFALWRNDPLPIRAVTLRYLRSTFTTPARIPFERNMLPILVINPTRDRMVSPAVTRQNFLRLGGPVAYAEIDYGHWATGAAFVAEYVALVDGFLTRQPRRTG
ncbi:MAG TPA: alpha/beta fold hydrolase [Anaerolineales bacterium]|nr:alpha/beta fold hydrolase [Anaerolineales bacterium]HRF48123.1 alpha/beta fold hydrolase [Anaerolineales bacterium]